MHSAYMPWQDVCPSICHTPVLCLNRYIYPPFFSPSGSPTIPVFPYQTGWRYSDGNSPPPNGGVECRWGIGTNRDRRQWMAWLSIDDVLDLWTTATIRRAPVNLYLLQHARLWRRQNRTVYTLLNWKHNLRSTYCSEANDRHEASQPLCDSRATCLVCNYTNVTYHHNLSCLNVTSQIS